MERFKATSSSLKRTRPRRRIIDGLPILECKICKARFKYLGTLSQHVLAVHQLKLSLQNRRVVKEVVDDRYNSGHKVQHKAEVEDEEEDEIEDENDDHGDSDDDDDEDDEVEGNEIWFTKENLALNCKLNAEASLEYLNEQVGGKRYELVEHGPTVASNPAVEHINFKAKEKDSPNAEVETFFAQMSYLRGGSKVDCCVSLGPSHELPHWRDANLGGCKLCKAVIHHPVVMVDKLRLK